MKVKESKPLPLAGTLHDLALLRSSDLDLSSLVPSNTLTSPSAGDAFSQEAVNTSMGRSYEFVREARAALKIFNRGEVELQGSRVEDARSKLEDVLKGLESAP